MDAKQFDTYAESLSKPDLVRSLVQAKASFDVAVALLDALTDGSATADEKEQACLAARRFVATYHAAEEASRNG
jgi:hypothetical protein